MLYVYTVCLFWGEHIKLHLFHISKNMHIYIYIFAREGSLKVSKVKFPSKKGAIRWHSTSCRPGFKFQLLLVECTSPFGKANEVYFGLSPLPGFLWQMKV